jgi:hypothetical protein
MRYLKDRPLHLVLLLSLMTCILSILHLVAELQQRILDVFKAIWWRLLAFAGASNRGHGAGGVSAKVKLKWLICWSVAKVSEPLSEAVPRVNLRRVSSFGCVSSSTAPIFLPQKCCNHSPSWRTWVIAATTAEETEDTAIEVLGMVVEEASSAREAGRMTASLSMVVEGRATTLVGCEQADAMYT